MAQGSNNGNIETQTAQVNIWSNNISMDNAPSDSTSYGKGVTMLDAEHRRVFSLNSSQPTNGNIYGEIYVTRYVNSSEKFNGFKFGIKPNGTFEDTFVNDDSYQAFLNVLDSGWANVPTGADYDSGTLIYRRFGRIVTVEGQTLKLKTSTVTAGNRGTAGTLPTGFRPSRTAYGGAFYGFHVSDLIEIGTDGSISIQTPANWSGGGCWFTVTFLTT